MQKNESIYFYISGRAALPVEVAVDADPPGSHRGGDAIWQSMAIFLLTTSKIEPSAHSLKATETLTEPYGSDP